MTNWHVVEGATEIEVTLFNGKSYDARLVGRDRTDDVAVLAIQAPPEELVPVVFGDSTRPAGGSAGLCPGEPLRPGADAQHRHHLQHGPPHPPPRAAITGPSRSSRSTPRSIPAAPAGRSWTATPG